MSTGSPSRSGNVTVYVKDINQPTLPTPFYSVLESVPVFVTLSTICHSLNSPDNSPRMALDDDGKTLYNDPDRTTLSDSNLTIP